MILIDVGIFDSNVYLKTKNKKQNKTRKLTVRFPCDGFDGLSHLGLIFKSPTIYIWKVMRTNEE